LADGKVEDETIQYYKLRYS